jgi:hypothetical protein
MQGVSVLRVTGTLLLVLAAAFAQNSSSRAVRWTEGAPDATFEVKNDSKIEGLKAGDVHIFVSLAEIKETEYNRVWMQVSNHGNSPIDFNPQSAVLLHGDKGLRAEVPDKAANSIQKLGESKAQELSSAHCDMMMSSGGRGGSSGGKTTTGGAGGGGCSPTGTEMQMSKQVLSFSVQQAQWVRDNALQAKPVAPGEEAKGAIVFKKEKKSADYILRVPIGGEVFEFPLSAQNKAPSYD